MAMDQKFLWYSALDAACTLECQQSFWDNLEPTFMEAYQRTVNIFPVLMFMQTRGVKVNMESLRETKRDVLEQSAIKQKELDALCGMPLNVNSPKQCVEYFYGKLGIPPYKNKQGNPTVDDLALQRLVRGTASRPSIPQAKLVQEIRSLNKLHSTYLDLTFDADDRMRCSYNPRGTKFGRLSSSETVFGTGTNFQNLPGAFKRFLVADEGYVFIEVDKRQAEWVVVAYASGDLNMINAVESGVDVHAYTAWQMYDVPIDVIKREAKLVGHSTDAEEIREIRQSDLQLVELMRNSPRSWPRTMSLRQCGKKSNHGLNYGEGDYQFSLLNEIEQREAKVIIELYHQTYPGIKLWYESIKRQLNQNRLLVNCFGRAIRFLDAWGDSLFKSAYSAIPQSTVVDSLNEAMQAIYDDTRICGKSGLNGDMLAQVHDSLLMQFPIAALKDRSTFEWLIQELKDKTSPIMCYNSREFKIASDFKFGLNWGEYKEDKNPLGMQEFEDYDSFMKALEQWENHSGKGTDGLA